MISYESSMMDVDASTLDSNKHILIWIIVIMNVIGNFGNIQLILVTWKTPDLQNKPGLLLAITAFSHLICNFSELFNVYFLVTNTPVIRRTCSYLLFPYMFFIDHQSVMALVLVVDLLIAINRPFWYQSVETKKYLALITSPAVIFGLFFLVVTLATANDQIIDICNPVLVTLPFWGRVWSIANVFINSLVVLAYIATIIIMRRRKTQENYKQTQLVQKRLSVSAVIFIFSWYLAILGVDLANIMDASSTVKAYIKSNMVFFAMLCYSQTFYVCLWRSSKYRSAFKSMIFCRSNDRPLSSIVVPVSRIGNSQKDSHI